jgi:hypothetical protein
VDKLTSAEVRSRRPEHPLEVTQNLAETSFPDLNDRTSIPDYLVPPAQHQNELSKSSGRRAGLRYSSSPPEVTTWNS